MADYEPTLKQRKWLKIYLEVGNATEAAMQVYNCQDRNSAKTIGWENLTKLDFTDLLEEAGVTDKLLQQKILEGLDANRTVSAKIIDKGATTQTDDFIDVPDFMARHKYLETALKLKQKLIEKKEVRIDMPQPILDALSKDHGNNQDTESK